jgi:hypothetical protein
MDSVCRDDLGLDHRCSPALRRYFAEESKRIEALGVTPGLLRAVPPGA